MLNEIFHETDLILSMKGYHRSPNYGRYYVNGERISVPYPWGANLRKPKHGGGFGMPDIILCGDHGYTIVISHGGRISPTDTLIQFPKWATENDFLGAFSRMENYIKHNYEYLPGLAAWSQGGWDG